MLTNLKCHASLSIMTDVANMTFLGVRIKAISLVVCECFVLCLDINNTYVSFFLFSEYISKNYVTIGRLNTVQTI